MTKYNFDIDGKNISSEDINEKKDFEKFYSGFQSKNKPLFKKGWFWTSSGIASVIISTLIFSNIHNQSNEFKTNRNFTKFSSDESTEKPLVDPPFKNLKINEDVFKVDANKGGIFKSRHGSIIKIPPFAFINHNGKIIKNHIVDIMFTEYKDVADQIISGIPMVYDSAGIKYMFSSAGMIKINGFIGDSAIQLSDKKNIEIEMKSNFSSRDYNFYCLNEKEKKWDYLGKDSVGKFNDGKLSDKQILTKFPEIETSNVDVPDDLIQIELQKTPEYQKRERKRIKIQQEIDFLRQTQPNKPQKADEKAIKFTLDVLEKENPELLPYKNVQFQLVGGGNIDPTHTQQNWNNVDLKTTENNELLVTFSKTNSADEVQYRVIPVLDGDAFKKAQNEYLNHIKKLQSKKQALADTEKKIKFFKKQIRSKQIDKAVIQAKTERLEKIAKFKKKELINRTAKQEVTRYFKVNNFGIFNSDKAKQMTTKKPLIVATILFDKKETEILTIDVFKNLNGVFSRYIYTKSEYASYENASTTVGISNGKVGVLNSTDDGQMKFNVFGKPNSKSELVKWLNI
ncbi:MAG: hypothetical protein CMP67_03970 [Flavobacteriales bacterium]|nr:hypothetical protein [Flavobacteriales bacterium]|tara:strand:- start:18183 stop:19886 length:1704 start_codon:yes stop_codon:yes gene_type:complete